MEKGLEMEEEIDWKIKGGKSKDFNGPAVVFVSTRCQQESIINQDFGPLGEKRRSGAETCWERKELKDRD